MEKHSLHGKVIEDIERPSKEIIEGFEKHDVCKVGDAMKGYGLMNYEIKPIEPGMTVAGPAVTVLAHPGDALYVKKAIEILQPGDVVVVDAGGFKNVSCTGERLSEYMQIQGAKGLVVDGAVRDSRGIIELGLPTFSRAVCTKIFGSNGPGAVNVPIQCGGVPVNPGDIIMADDDGAVCVPREDAEEVLKTADEHLEGELARRKEIVEDGKSIKEVFDLDEKLNKWK